MSVCHKAEFTETARTAVRGTCVSDWCVCSDIRVETRIPEGHVALGRQVAVIAHELIGRKCSIVIGGVDSDPIRAGGERNSDESEDREVFHACGWVSKANGWCSSGFSVAQPTQPL